MRLLPFLIYFFIVTGNSVFGQMGTIEIPYSYQFKLKPVTDFISMPEINQNLLKSADSGNYSNRFKSKRFAKDFDAQFDPFNSGEWQSLPNGGKVWRLGIKSLNAYSLYLVFNKYHLEKGASVFVYNKNYNDLNGPYTSYKNNRNNILPIVPTPGDELTIELDVPPGMEYFGELTLRKIWHDYTNEFGKSRYKKGFNTMAGECNIDINCPLGKSWQLEKQAVCKLIANGELCTGTMVNNAKGKNIPYLLTAYHCIEDSSIAASAIFYFSYESPFCNSQGESLYEKAIEGAILLSTTPNKLDFSLLLLNKFPPISYRAYLAGWETDPVNPAGYSIVGATCIHHPGGSVKKISYDKDLLTTGNFGENFNLNSHWLVSNWEYGVTEGGSSGAPLFNNNHRIVGTLTGGDSYCGNPVNDYFTKFLLDWDYYPQPYNQLKYYLDPDNTDTTYVNGADPYGFTDENCDTFTNIRSSESIVIDKNNTLNGYISGHNAAQWKQFAEKFYSQDTIQIPELILNVAHAYSGDYLSNIDLKFWKGIDKPDTLVYSKTIFLKQLKENAYNDIRLDTVLLMQGTFFIGYSVNYQLPSDTFALYYASKRNDNTSTMFIQNNSTWTNIINMDGINYPTALDIQYIGCKNLDLKLDSPKREVKNFKWYPNPCVDHFQIEFDKPVENIQVFCFDIQGKSLKLPYRKSENIVYFDVSNLKSGLYWFSVINHNKKYSGKFMVIK